MKNDSWFFPFSMPCDSFFDSNKDGKLTGFETMMRDSYWLEQQNKRNEEHNSKKDFNSYSAPKYYSSHNASKEEQIVPKCDKYEWRKYCEDGSEYDIYPEDYENEEEYQLALEEAMEYTKNELDDACEFCDDIIAEFDDTIALIDSLLEKESDED